MGALGSGEQTGVEALVAHGIAGAVVEAEVVANALSGGSGGKASREGDDIETHVGLVVVLGYVEILYES